MWITCGCFKYYTLGFLGKGLSDKARIYGICVFKSAVSLGQATIYALMRVGADSPPFAGRYSFIVHIYKSSRKIYIVRRQTYVRILCSYPII